jgi:hypothetical protein
LEEEAHTFVLELWELLVSAEENHGIPLKFVEEQEKLMQEKMVNILYSTLTSSPSLSLSSSSSSSSYQNHSKIFLSSTSSPSSPLSL